MLMLLLFFSSNVIPVLSRNWTYTVAVFSQAACIITLVYCCFFFFVFVFFFFLGAMIQVLRFFQLCGKETALLVCEVR
jgi:hypothetical protein